jgi:hypothetical protein
MCQATGRKSTAELDKYSGKIHASLYRHSSGALVFGAGTVQWRGLMPIMIAVHPPMPWQATMNLFGDMNVLPGTPQAGLTILHLQTIILHRFCNNTLTHNQNINTSSFINISGTCRCWW